MSATTQLPAERRQTLGDVVASETIRATSIRTTWWILALAAVLSVLSALSTGFDEGTTVTSVAINVTAVSLSATAVFAVLSVTDEFSLGTLITTVSATPNRMRLLRAKLLTAILFGVIASLLPLLVAVAILAIARTGGLPMSETSTFAPFGAVLANVIIAVFGVYFGAVIRNSTLGVTLVLAIVFVVPLLSFPLGESPFFLPDLGISDAASTFITPLSGYLAFNVVVVIVWIVIPAIIGTRLFVRREV